MIRVDEDDPVGEISLSFPYRNVQIKRSIDPKEFYDLTIEIGRGKFGTVYKCKEKTTGLELAAKFIGVPKKEDRRNVEREVDIMRSLQHPRLLQIYDAFENGKMMCVILELIEGGELFERVIDDDFVLTEKSCAVFMRQICEGIDFIHKQQILHLDMKPENILCLTKTGNRIKIIDFGLARKYDPNKKLQVLFGTPEFVAPEVVNFDQISYGTDMWSVGVICYVLLSGLSPFMGATDVQTMANVTIGKYDFDDEAFKEISGNAQDFIAKLLVKDINRRMTAGDCLNHTWLQRRTRPEISNMEVAKDNLRQFVERWNEHPNSPYVFEIETHMITPCNGKLQLSDSLHSLEGMSPSPCGSLASSVGSDDAFTLINNNNVSNEMDSLTVTLPDHVRRASDSKCIMKGSDVSERVNLADEIRKLTDKLFQLSTMPDFSSNSNGQSKFQPNNNYTIPKPFSTSSSFVAKELTHSISNTNENLNGQTPWRRPKFRINTSSRDVPLYAKTNPISLSKHLQTELPTFQINEKRDNFTNSSSNSMENTVTGTKDMLLRLLEQWDGPQNATRSNTRHCSVSSDWSENESLGQRTISSLNLFFQSRSTSKKSHPFVKPNGIN